MKGGALEIKWKNNLKKLVKLQRLKIDFTLAPILNMKIIHKKIVRRKSVRSEDLKCISKIVVEVFH